MKKILRMELRLTPDEKSIIICRAKLLGVSRSAYIVGQAIEKKWRPQFTITTKVNPALLFQIQGIARNLNQVAWRVNLDNKTGSPINTIRILATLEGISQQIRELISIKGGRQKK